MQPPQRDPLQRITSPGEVIGRACAELGEQKWAQDPAVRGVWAHGGSSAEVHSSQSVMITKIGDIKHWTEVQEQQLCTSVAPGERGTAPPS